MKTLALSLAPACRRLLALTRHPATIVALLAAAGFVLLSLPPRIVQAVPVPANPGHWSFVRKDAATAVHMALMRGDVGIHPLVPSLLLWYRADEEGEHYGFEGALEAWMPNNDYADSAFQNLTPLTLSDPPVNVFCSGASSLANGDLLISGGDDQSIGDTGIKNSVVFHGKWRTWEQKGDMAQRRWYPTSTTLPDGKVLVTAGSQYAHMAVFGGRVNGGATLSDTLYRFGLTSTGQWDAPIPPPSSALTPREGHTLARLEGGPAA